MSTYYRIYCNTEDGWQYAWSDTPLTVCPIDAGHTVNNLSVQDIMKKTLLTIIQNTTTTKLKKFVRLIRFQYKTDYGNLHSVELLGYLSSAGSATIEFFDTTNNVLLLTASYSNTVQDVIVDLGRFESTPESDAIIEMNVKIDSGSATIYLDSISLFVEQ